MEYKLTNTDGQEIGVIDTADLTFENAELLDGRSDAQEANGQGWERWGTDAVDKEGNQYRVIYFFLDSETKYAVPCDCEGCEVCIKEHDVIPCADCSDSAFEKYDLEDRDWEGHIVSIIKEGE